MSLSRAISVAALATVALASPAGHAAVHPLAQYPFTGSSLNSTDSDLNSTASAFTKGPGFTSAVINTGLGNPAPSISIGAGSTPSSEPTITGTGYYEFTLTPMAGFVVNLNNLTFDYAVSGNVTASYVVRSSISGFGTDIAPPVSTGSGTFAPATISLTAPQYQNLSTPVTFRIYIWDDKSGSMSDLLDNITLNGDFAAVPEPSTWAMMLAGAGLLGATQRFFRKRT
jgi:hypothetical protein